MDQFVKNTEVLTNLKVLSRKWALSNGVYDFDKCKILVSTANCILNGEEIYEILLKQYHLQMEMASRDYVLGIATICDTQEGFDRLERALLEIDALCQVGMDSIKEKFPFLQKHKTEKDADFYKGDVLCQKETKVLPIYEACEMTKERVILQAAEGKISGEFVYLYPPGVPMIVPGERITEEFIELCMQCIKLGLPLQGMQDLECRTIAILKGY